jgi:hypothetical protein
VVKELTREEKKQRIHDLQIAIQKLIEKKEECIASKPRTDKEIDLKLANIAKYDKEIVDINRRQYKISQEFYFTKHVGEVKDAKFQ